MESMIMIIISAIIGLILLVAWILTLVRQAKKAQWLWFVLTIIFPIVLVFYWISRIFVRERR